MLRQGFYRKSNKQILAFLFEKNTSQKHNIEHRWHWKMKKNKHSIFNAEHKCSNLPHQNNVHIIWCCCLQCHYTYLRLWLLLILVCIGKLHRDKILTQYDLISFIHLFCPSKRQFLIRRMFHAQLWSTQGTIGRKKTNDL